MTHQFAALSDRDLDRLVKVFKSTKPDSGIRWNTLPGRFPALPWFASPTETSHPFCETG